jgi:hypothetical protein
MRNTRQIKVIAVLFLTCAALICATGGAPRNLVLQGAPPASAAERADPGERSPQNASDDPDTEIKAVRDALQAVYDQQNVYLANKDADSYWKTYSDDFVCISPAGEKRTQADLRPAMESLFKLAESIEGTSTIHSVTVDGEEGDDGKEVVVGAVVVVDEVTTLVPLRSGAGKKRVLKIESRSEETWRRNDKQWLLMESRVIASKTTLDGRVVPE